MKNLFFTILIILISSCLSSKQTTGVSVNPKLYHKSYRTTKKWPYHKSMHMNKPIKMQAVQCPAMSR